MQNVTVQVLRAELMKRRLHGLTDTIVDGTLWIVWKRFLQVMTPQVRESMQVMRSRYVRRALECSLLRLDPQILSLYVMFVIKRLKRFSY